MAIVNTESFRPPSLESIPPQVRLGHAVRGSGTSPSSVLRDALDIASGRLSLDARPPREKRAVSRAEEILKARPRPIYAFLGLLHPDLGTVGLIVSPTWAKRCVQGVSRCDTGGLAGRFGGFACVEEEKLEEALLEVSFMEESVDRWLGEFAGEVQKSYTRAERDYVAGEEPECMGWQDIRPRAVELGGQT